MENLTDALKKQMITTFVLYGALSLVNLAYLSQIIKLNQRRFHLTMFTLLELCFLSYILSFALYKSNAAISIFLVAYYAIGQVIYTIFAVKYFILALKIQSPTEANEQRLHRTENLIFIV